VLGTERIVFGNGLDWKKLIGTIVDLIDVRKKVIMFCIKKWTFLFCNDFLIWKMIKSDWCDIKSRNIRIDFEKKKILGILQSQSNLLANKAKGMEPPKLIN
jgi:hypothetical protein